MVDWLKKLNFFGFLCPFDVTKGMVIFFLWLESVWRTSSWLWRLSVTCLPSRLWLTSTDTGWDVNDNLIPVVEIATHNSFSDNVILPLCWKCQGMHGNWSAVDKRELSINCFGEETGCPFNKVLPEKSVILLNVGHQCRSSRVHNPCNIGSLFEDISFVQFGPEQTLLSCDVALFLVCSHQYWGKEPVRIWGKVFRWQVLIDTKIWGSMLSPLSNFDTRLQCNTDVTDLGCSLRSNLLNFETSQHLCMNGLMVWNCLLSCLLYLVPRVTAWIVWLLEWLLNRSEWRCWTFCSCKLIAWH